MLKELHKSSWCNAVYALITAALLLIVNAQSVNAQSVRADEIITRAATQAATICDKPDGPNTYKTEHFHINYSTIDGGLSIEEYGEVLEAVYALEVTSYGWAAPPVCGAGQCNGNATPLGKYPVHVSDTLPEFISGYVTGGGLYSGNVIGDNPNTAAVETHSATTCMVLQNNFSAVGGSALQNLRETVAHEFLHAIQEGYGDDRDAPESDMWYESTAVYIEDEFVDDSVNDHQYLWPRVENCLADWPSRSEPDGLSEYSNFLLFRYAAEQAGGTHEAGGGEDVIQALWENIAAQQPAVTAFGNALQSRTSPLPILFHEYAISLKFSRSCGGGYTAPYCFAEGDSYRATTFSTVQTHGSMAAEGASTFNGTIRDDFAINWVKLPINERFSLALQNLGAGGALRASVACDSGSQIRVTPFPDPLLGGGAQSELAEVDTNGCVDAVVAITNQAQSSDANLCTERSYRLVSESLTVAQPEPQPTNSFAFFPIAITTE